ncbi:hypothetical protein C2G38_2211416 [Gigaspora rosea]|uniref:Uncharacterized protein n=1 Tax=Gigaspora rosea TaxID=44941 RepID=A0A397UEG3_9GLOM|nr:hypothetical protein C2G38_2211416 [Gigaspora rosea]
MKKNTYPKEVTKLFCVPRSHRESKGFQRDIRKKLLNSESRKRNSIVSKDANIKKLKKECAMSFATLTWVQAIEVQEIIDKAFGNCNLDDEQIPQALEFVLKVIEEVVMFDGNDTENIIYLPPYLDGSDNCHPIQSQKHSIKISMEEVVYLGADLPGIKASIVLPEDKRPAGTSKNHLEKFRKKRVSITKVLESYYDPGVPSEDGGERSTLVKEDQKQEKEIEIDPEITLEDLVDSYLRVLETWISKFGIPEEPKPEYAVDNLPKIGEKEECKAFERYKKSADMKGKNQGKELKVEKVKYHGSIMEKNSRYKASLENSSNFKYGNGKEKDAENDGSTTENLERKTGVEKNETYNLNSNSAEEMVYNEIRDDETLVGKDNESDKRLNCDLPRRSLKKEALYLEELLSISDSYQNGIGIGLKKDESDTSKCHQAHEMNHVKEIQVEKDEHETFKDYRKPTEPNHDNKAETRLESETDKYKASIHYQESVDMDDDDGINLKQCDKKRSEICDKNDKYKKATLEGLRKVCEWWSEKAIEYKRIICKKIETL